MVFAQSFVSLALVLPSCMLPRVLPRRVPLPRNRDPRAKPNQESFMKGEAGKLGLLVNSPVGSPGGREKQHGELCSWGCQWRWRWRGPGARCPHGSAWTEG